MQQTLQKIHLYIVFCIVIAYLPWIYFKYLEYIDKSFKILEIPFPFNILYILAPVWEQGAFSAFLTQVLQTLLELQDFLNQKKQTAFEMARTTRLKRCKNSWHPHNFYSFTSSPWATDAIYDTADKGQISAYFFDVVVVHGNMSTRICVNALKCDKCVQIRACCMQVNYALKRGHSLALSWSVNDVYSLVTGFAVPGLGLS